MPRPGSMGQGQAGKRPVRSYVIRGGRLTSGQARALEELWPKFGIDRHGGDGPLDLAALFGNDRPVIAEIGFGNGEATWRTAQAWPEQNFIGVEVHRPGVGRLLLALEKHELSNVRIACEDAVGFMGSAIPRGSLDGIRIYFPDPWPKKRHHKRRLVQSDFVDTLAQGLRRGGVLHLATDWEPYAEHMVEVLGASDGFRNMAKNGPYAARPPWRPQTRYERRGLKLGHQVFDLLYERVG